MNILNLFENLSQIRSQGLGFDTLTKIFLKHIYLNLLLKNCISIKGSWLMFFVENGPEEETRENNLVAVVCFV
jgi:hypothetical protein